MTLKNLMFPMLLVPLVAFAKPLATSEAEIYRSPNIKVYAFEKVLDRWDDKQWSYFSDLIYRESGWNYTADNPKSSACGLGQTMMSIHGKDLPKDFCSEPYGQIDWTVNYISDRYGTPQKAIQFHNKKGFY